VGVHIMHEAEGLLHLRSNLYNNQMLEIFPLMSIKSI